MVFNRKVYDTVKNDVRTYLENVSTGKETKESILFYGKARTGKTYLIHELKDEFEDCGYTEFRDMMPWTPRNMTRNRWKKSFVVATTDPTYENDPRFKVFKFTE